MRKKDLAVLIAQDMEVSEKKAHGFINSLLSNITKTLKDSDEKVILTQFGTFSKIKRKERMGRNPQTGEPLKLKARNAIKFKMGTGLKEEIN